jgi:hypothetical protein
MCSARDFFKSGFAKASGRATANNDEPGEIIIFI